MSATPHFVPNDHAGTRKDTAVLLVGTASEFGLPQRSIRTTTAGFWITDKLASVLYDESDNTSTTQKTSGNRAAKKNSKKG